MSAVVESVVLVRGSMSVCFYGRYERESFSYHCSDFSLISAHVQVVLLVSQLHV